MDDTLKAELSNLLNKFPELDGKQLSFSGDSIDYIHPNNRNSQVCNITVQPPVTIVGTNSKIEIRTSPIHGYGIFTTDSVSEGELIEQSKLLKLGWRGKYLKDPVLKDYAWANNKCDCEECKNHGFVQYLALGFGSMYNHNDDPNTIQDINFRTETITIKARRDLKKDEEIFLHYGKKYWLIRNFWKELHKNEKLQNFSKPGHI